MSSNRDELEQVRQETIIEQTERNLSTYACQTALNILQTAVRTEVPEFTMDPDATLYTKEQQKMFDLRTYMEEHTGEILRQVAETTIELFNFEQLEYEMALKQTIYMLFLIQHQPKAARETMTRKSAMGNNVTETGAFNHILSAWIQNRVLQLNFAKAELEIPVEFDESVFSSFLSNEDFLQLEGEDFYAVYYPISFMCQVFQNLTNFKFGQASRLGNKSEYPFYVTAREYLEKMKRALETRDVLYE